MVKKGQTLQMIFWDLFDVACHGASNGGLSLLMRGLWSGIKKTYIVKIFVALVFEVFFFIRTLVNIELSI